MHQLGDIRLDEINILPEDEATNIILMDYKLRDNTMLDWDSFSKLICTSFRLRND